MPCLEPGDPMFFPENRHGSLVPGELPVEVLTQPTLAMWIQKTR